MICQPCKDQRHNECPSKMAEDPSRPGMALSPEGVEIQLSGLCPCQHKVPAPVAEEEAPNWHEAIHHANDQVRAAGITPPKCPMCDGSYSDIGTEFVAQVDAA